MNTIWQFDLLLSDDPVSIAMPMGAVVRHVGPAGPEMVSLWAEVDSDRPRVNRMFVVKQANQPVGRGLSYVGSAKDGTMWHVYEVTG